MNAQQKIVPALWYDREAVEAAKLYTALFPNSRVKHTATLQDTPSGSVDTVSFELAGLAFSAISAGPHFKFNPSISFQVACTSREEVKTLWQALSEGGMALMELGEYPFSELFGWTRDRYGLSWQVMHTGGQPPRQKITPALLFVGEQAGRAEEAVRLYVSTFPDSTIGEILRYGPGEDPDEAGTVKQAAFSLAGQEFAAMDSAHGHDFSFSEAISFMVSCDTQAEIDAYWEKLSAFPEAEQCGWLKDRFGVSWQIVPRRMEEMLHSGSSRQVARVTEAFLGMKKLDLAEMERAFQAGE
jgi:predicted 3-demethylubiquinone-9 3-methyltransferase (glyoxalase superfamily)